MPGMTLVQKVLATVIVVGLNVLAFVYGGLLVVALTILPSVLFLVRMVATL